MMLYVWLIPFYCPYLCNCTKWTQLYWYWWWVMGNYKSCQWHGAILHGWWYLGVQDPRRCETLVVCLVIRNICFKICRLTTQQQAGRKVMVWNKQFWEIKDVFNSSLLNHCVQKTRRHAVHGIYKTISNYLLSCSSSRVHYCKLLVTPFWASISYNLVISL